MARLRLELRDIAELVRDTANRHQPLVAESFSFGKWLFKLHFEVTWHALAEVRVDGPIVLEFELEAGYRKLRFDALIPNLGMSGPCTMAGGFWFKDRTRPLEISLDGAAQVEVRFAETDDGSFDTPAVQVALRGLWVRPHVFPKWVERRFQRPLERAVEGTLAKLIVESIPKALTKLRLASPAAEIAEVSNQHGHDDAADDLPRQPVLSTLAYRTSYYLAYGLCYPVLMFGSRIPTENPAVQGLRDGAASAKSGVRRLTTRAAQPANRGVVDGQAEFASGTT